MRFGEAAPDEEWFGRIVFGALVEKLDREVGDHVVARTLTVAVENEDLVRVRGAVVVSGKNRKDAIGPREAGVRDVPRFAGLRWVHGFDVAVEVGPGFVIVEAGVEELTAA